MPSPFPGMDPFLEDPKGWLDFHSSIIPEIRNILAPRLAPAYYVRIEERVYITHPEDDPGFGVLIPDVIVSTVYRREPVPVPAGDVMTVAIAQPAYAEALREPEIHDRYIEIYDARSHTIVTAIEVLSPVNKTKGARGREALLEKRKALLEGGASVLEIDLLRDGLRDKRVADKSDYIVTLKRHGDPRLAYWAIDIRDELPTVAVPLRPPHADAPLPLQQVFTTTYDRAMYAVSVDYDQSIPPPRLKPADAAWVQRTLQAWRERQDQTP